MSASAWGPPVGTPGSVAADLLLLSVGHRSSWLTRGPVHVVVAAGVVVDELLAGRPLQGIGPDRAGVAAHLGAGGLRRHGDVVAALVAAGAVAPLRTRIWGLFPRVGLQVLQPWAVERARARLAAALRPGVRPAPTDAALAALAAVGGLARAHEPVATDERQMMREHLNSLAAATGPEVAEVVMALRRLLGRGGDSGDGIVLFVPGSDNDGYGDGGGSGDSSGGDGGGDGGDGGGD